MFERNRTRDVIAREQAFSKRRAGFMEAMQAGYEDQ